MPTHQRKAINRHIEEFAKQVKGKILFVGVNYQWDKYYRNLMSGMETMDIKKNVIEPDIYGDIQYCPEIPDETYNGVIMVGIWELLKEPQYALFEIMRILKKDGKLLFGFPPRTLEKFEVIYYKSNEPVYLLGTIKKNEY